MQQIGQVSIASELVQAERDGPSCVGVPDLVKTQRWQILKNPAVDFFQMPGVEFPLNRIQSEFDKTSPCVSGFECLSLLCRQGPASGFVFHLVALTN